jgi:hypothetical protein
MIIKKNNWFKMKGRFLGILYTEICLSGKMSLEKRYFGRDKEGQKNVNFCN